MFKTFMGPVEDTASVVYLRPETAQGIFVNFQNVLEHRRARRSRSASPRSASRSATRSRPATSSSARASSSRWRWSSSSSRARTTSGTSTGGRSASRWYSDATASGPSSLRLRDARAGRAGALRQGLRRRRVRVPVRLVGARGHRQPHRLRPEAARRVQRQGPLVLRRGGAASATCPTSSSRRPAPTAPTLAFLVDAYDEDEAEGETRIVLRLHPRSRPIKAAVFPLLRKDGHPEKAQAIYDRPAASTSPSTTTRPARSAGAIAVRTRSAPRSASPSTTRPSQDDTVTVRDRDTMTQIRIPEDRLVAELTARLA